MNKPASPPRPFRFFDNREKYLLFVTTCSEKWVIGQRVGEEIAHLRPAPPAITMFDAGTGDGTVLASVLRQLHGHHPTVPLLVVGKEISLEDIRLTLDKLADRFFEHPLMVVAVTNMLYREAPWLRPDGRAGQRPINWQEVALEGNCAHEFDRQINALRPQLADWWKVETDPDTGNPAYAEPTVLVLYRKDHRFSLDAIVPRPGEAMPGYDLVIAAQPYRARSSAVAKARNVLEPLSRALKPGGRLMAIQSTGQDPGMEIIRKVWPGEEPFRTPAPMLMERLRELLAAQDLEDAFRIDADTHNLFRYNLHTMPNEVSEHIGTSTLLAAWNAAVYVAQIDDERVTEAMSDKAYLDATQDVLERNGGLWFVDESFVISRRESSG